MANTLFVDNGFALLPAGGGLRGGSDIAWRLAGGKAAAIYPADGNAACMLPGAPVFVAIYSNVDPAWRPAHAGDYAGVWGRHVEYAEYPSPEAAVSALAAL